MSRKVKLYLRGPMTGIPKLNYPMFHAWADNLRKAGYVVVSPAEINTLRTPESLAMKRDISALAMCDAVADLPGWENSAGAAKEGIVMAMLGMQNERVDFWTAIGEKRAREILLG